MELTTNEQRISDLFSELVPACGPAASVAGELVRAVNRIDYRLYNDGDQVGIGYGKETCDCAAKYLKEHGNNVTSIIATYMLTHPIRNEERYKNRLDALMDAVATYIESHPELKDQMNEDDMLNYM